MAGVALAMGPGLWVAPAAESFVWENAAPEDEGVDSGLIGRMLTQIRRENIDVDSFILVRHGKIVTEVYLYPDSATSRHVLYSASKSFTSALVGIAIEEGLFTSVDDRVVDIFAGVTMVPPSANLSRMTLRHLLTMSTGHATDTTYRIMYTGNWERAFLELPVENPPGAPFVYNSGATFMLSAAIQRRAGVNAATYGRSRLFEPLGITNWTWDVAPGNITVGGWGLSLCSRDMAKFGLLYLHGGVWEGRQIIPAAWVAESGRKQVGTGSSGTFWESGYGYQFWMNDFGGYRADGARGQFIFVLPAYDAVVVFTANLPANWIPADLARTYVIPALQASDVLPANPKSSALIARLAAVMAIAPGAAGSSPFFTTLPEDQAVALGGTAAFTVGVSGSPVPSIQWYHDGVAVPDATATTLTIDSVARRDAGEYTAVAHNASGHIVSLPVSLQVQAVPEIRRAPVSQVVCAGDAAAFCVEADGDDVSYAWIHDGAAVPDADAATLFLDATSEADAGIYQVTVSNARGSVTSAPVRLTVAASEERSRLVNLSIRALAGMDDQTLIIGLGVAGSEEAFGLPVLLRGVGATLAGYHVINPLADPAIVLHAGPAPILGNGDWRGSLLVSESAAHVGAFDLPRASDDAALFTVLTPRTYTMHVVSSLPGGRGIALGECYDAADSAVAGGPRLINLSARAFTAGGDETLIAGFVVAGPVPLRLLVRGIGPGLIPHDVSGVLEDPHLAIYARDTVIAENDDWGGGLELSDAFARAGAFEIAADSRDAALIVTLPAGAYTAHVTGHAGSAGVALIEVYEVEAVSGKHLATD